MESDRILSRLGFSMVAPIGRGSYGRVILATSERYPDPVAIKIMDRRIMNILFSPEYIRLIFKYLPRELAILRRAKHPHIVEVHEIFKRSGWVFVVMEPAAMDLQRKLYRHHHIPIGQAKEWFSQLLSAVIYLHQQDIVHRDLKCENVLLTKDGQVKLTDFGCGRFSRGFPELCRTCCGTLQYCAPEQLMDKPYDAKKSDVWSLGLILYLMVTGVSSTGCEFWTNIPRHEPGVVKFPDWIPVEESCRDIISSMLEFYPCDRPSAVAVAQHPWLQMRRESADATSVTSPRVEAVEEEETEEQQEEKKKEDSDGCGLFCAAKRAAQSKIVAPILRAPCTIGRRMRKLLKRTSSSSSQRDASHASAAPAEASAGRASEHLQQDGTPDVPTEKGESKHLRFPQCKILKKMKRVQPL